MSWHATGRRAVQRIGLEPRYLRRLRWISKARAVRRVGAPLRANVRYVLSDPEPDNFTYELANEAELAAWVQAVSRATPDEVNRLLAEARTDPCARRATSSRHGPALVVEQAFASIRQATWLVRIDSPIEARLDRRDRGSRRTGLAGAAAGAGAKRGRGSSGTAGVVRYQPSCRVAGRRAPALGASVGVHAGGPGRGARRRPARRDLHPRQPPYVRQRALRAARRGVAPGPAAEC